MSTTLQEEPKTVNYAYLNGAQFLVRIILGACSCALSLAGSTTILYLVVKQGKWKTEIYHRLVVGLSIMDLILTCSIIATPFLVPAETNLMFASGSFASCEIVGFFFHFYTGGTIYNALLASFYHLMVVNNKQERQICRLLEPWGHLVAFGIPIISGVAAIFLDAINPSISMGVCTYGTYPAHCEDLEDIECQRGSNTGMFVFLINLIYMSAAFLGIVLTIRVFLSVRNQLRRNLRYGSGQLSETQAKRIKAVGTQATLYCLAFINGFWPVLLATVMVATNSQKYDELEEPPDLGENAEAFVLSLLIFIFFPLQGFLNCLVYIRPRLIRWKDANPHETWFWAFRSVLSNNPVPTTSRTNHLRSMQRGGGRRKSFLGKLFGPRRKNDESPDGEAGPVDLHQQDSNHPNTGRQGQQSSSIAAFSSLAPTSTNVSTRELTMRDRMDQEDSTNNGLGDVFPIEETPHLDHGDKGDALDVTYDDFPSSESNGDVEVGTQTGEITEDNGDGDSQESLPSPGSIVSNSDDEQIPIPSKTGKDEKEFKTNTTEEFEEE